MPGELILKPVSDAVEPVAKAIGGTLADFWHGILGDRVTAWRIRNASRIDAKLQAELATRGIKLNLVGLPESFAFRWFERATEADEPEIQKLFAKLLSNAADGNKDALYKRNVDLVSNLTPDDAKFLSFVVRKYEDFRQASSSRYFAFAITYDYMFLRSYKIEVCESELPIDALLSQGILRLEREFKMDGSEVGRSISLAMSGYVRGMDIGLSHMFGHEEKLVLTEVGKSLLHALFPEQMGSRASE